MSEDNIVTLFDTEPHVLSMFAFCFSVFNQGEEGTSWYIIQKGSVNVVIYGKVTFMSFHEALAFTYSAVIYSWHSYITAVEKTSKLFTAYFMQ